MFLGRRQIVGCIQYSLLLLLGGTLEVSLVAAQPATTPAGEVLATYRTGGTGYGPEVFFPSSTGAFRVTSLPFSSILVRTPTNISAPVQDLIAIGTQEAFPPNTLAGAALEYNVDTGYLAVGLPAGGVGQHGEVRIGLAASVGTGFAATSQLLRPQDFPQFFAQNSFGAAFGEKLLFFQQPSIVPGIEDTFLAVGATRASAGACNQQPCSGASCPGQPCNGAVFLYKLTGTTWTPWSASFFQPPSTFPLTQNNIRPHFGASLAVFDGDQDGVVDLFVGAPQADYAFRDQGVVGVVRRAGTSQSSYSPQDILLANTAQSEAHFGTSLVADRNVVAVGAPGQNTGSGPGWGLVELYYRGQNNQLVFQSNLGTRIPHGRSGSALALRSVMDPANNTEVTDLYISSPQNSASTPGAVGIHQARLVWPSVTTAIYPEGLIRWLSRPAIIKQDTNFFPQSSTNRFATTGQRLSVIPNVFGDPDTDTDLLYTVRATYNIPGQTTPINQDGAIAFRGAKADLTPSAMPPFAFGTGCFMNGAPRNAHVPLLRAHSDPARSDVRVGSELVFEAELRPLTTTQPNFWLNANPVAYLIIGNKYETTYQGCPLYSDATYMANYGGNIWVYPFQLSGQPVTTRDIIAIQDLPTAFLGMEYVAQILVEYTENGVQKWASSNGLELRAGL